MITTEIYTVAPQYVRLFDFTVTLQAGAGYSRAVLREAIAKKLETYFHVLHGGADGKGFPFGGTIHHADMVAAIFRVSGVDRVEFAECWYDGHAPESDGIFEPLSWRPDRSEKRRLINCVENELDDVEIRLTPDENVFVDDLTFNVIVR